MEKLPVSRKRKTKNPCLTCFLHHDLCLCNQIPKLNLKTKVCLIIHSKELRRTTNTGRLAVHALLNSELKIRGVKDHPADLSSLLSPEYFPVLLYPSDEAIELNQDFLAHITKPILLIVPDGNWRQASKVPNRHPELMAIPRVKITTKNPMKLFLRKETTDFGMATLQAIAYALEPIEGVEVKNKLLDLYNLKLERTLKGRGQKNSI